MVLLQEYNQDVMLIWEIQEPPYHTDQERIVAALMSKYGMTEDRAVKAHQAACLDNYITRNLIVDLPYHCLVADEVEDGSNGIFFIDPRLFDAEIKRIARFNDMSEEEAFANVEWFFDNLDMTLNVEEESCQ